MLSRYAKLLLLAPTAGSLLVCSLSLVVGAVALSRLTSRSVNRGVFPQGSVPALRPLRNVPAESSPLPAKSDQPLKVNPLAAIRPVKKVGNIPDPIFRGLIADEDRRMLRQHVHEPVNDVVRGVQFRAFIDSVVPYAPFHYGVDMPLTRVLEGLLSRSEEDVELRDDRYVMISTTNGHGMSRAFLWSDLNEGIALGGVFFHPANGEPTPTLTLFSKQVTTPAIHVSELPKAFVQDLNQWVAESGVQPLVTRYFVNSTNQKSVLRHEENYCVSSAKETLPIDQDCDQANEEARNIDSNASSFLNQTRYASNATERMIAATTHNNK